MKFENCFNEIHYLIDTATGLVYMTKSYYHENFPGYSILYKGSLEEVNKECKQRSNKVGQRQADNEPISHDNKKNGKII